ncbi:MAG: DNA polymerase III subunit delta' [Gammaproteobacteria bacterium]|nr:DNA polymerase III subunit delta' [Gammaproteobacteria bacterium]
MSDLGIDVPWLVPVQQSLTRALAADRLGHALLLQVAPGLGGDWMANWIAARLYCTAAADPRPCGECLACRRVSAGELPDLLRVQPIENSKEIRIDQVRELAAELALTSHSGGRKVAIITPADRLNRNAANALLKTLEEPPGNSLLILVTGEPSRLPVTVMSRCTRLGVPIPDNATLTAWLRSHGDRNVNWEAVLTVLGARPFEALRADAAALVALREDTLRALGRAAAGTLDPVDTAESWGKDDYALRLACIESWLLERIREWASGAGSAQAARGTQVEALFAALEELREARQWTDTPVNKPLAIERLLWRLIPAASSRRPG